MAKATVCLTAVTGKDNYRRPTVRKDKRPHTHYTHAVRDVSLESVNNAGGGRGVSVAVQFSTTGRRTCYFFVVRDLHLFLSVWFKQSANQNS